MEKETSLHNLKQNISTAVFESHSHDARYTQQGNTSPACTAQWGTGGNNMPLVAEKKAFAMQRIGEYKESKQASTLAGCWPVTYDLGTKCPKVFLKGGSAAPAPVGLS